MTDRSLPLAGFPPKAYLIGAQKAGTTSLAGLLAEHPDLALSRPKEPDFYTGQWNKGLDWYRSRFPDAGNAVLLDASTSYSMAPVVSDERSIMNDVPRRIFELRPDARFIYIVRDPVDRAISAYWHAVRAGEENRPISDCMSERSMYLRGSRYAFQLEHYLRLFPRDRFLVLRTRDFADKPVEIVMRCWRFLGLDPELAPNPAIERRNESYVITGPLNWMLSIPGAKKATKSIWKSIRGKLSPEFRARLKARISKRPPEIPHALRERIAQELAGEIQRLKQLTGVDLS